MRLEGGGGMPLRLIAPAQDLRALDAAFPELLEHVPIDDWPIRTGASREEIGAVWTGIAGSRHVPIGDGVVTVAISERAIEVLEAALFELARDRLASIAGLEERTGVRRDEWVRLYRELTGLLERLDLAPDAPHVADPLPAELKSVGGLTLGGFRQAGLSIADAEFAGVALEEGDARAATVENAIFTDLACREVRLIASRLTEVTVSGAFSSSAVVDCAFERVTVSGVASAVRFIGCRFADVDLRATRMTGCRFYEATPGEGALLPDGTDSFVVPVRTVARAFDPLQARLGRETVSAIGSWCASEEADYVGIGPALWAGELLPRGAHDDDEVEYEVMERLYRLRVSSIAGSA